MIATIPRVGPDEIQAILDELAQEGKTVPQPEEVSVELGEDFEGDPVYLVSIVFPATIPADFLPWPTVSPLVARVDRLVFRKGGYDIPVLTAVKRLGETGAVGHKGNSK